MSKTKTYEEQMANADAKIQQLMNRKKQLRQKHNAEERKERTSRLCRRHGLLEKYMPDLITLTDEQFENFIRRGINTSYGQKILGEIISQTKEVPSPSPTVDNYSNGSDGNANPPYGSQLEA